MATVHRTEAPAGVTLNYLGHHCSLQRQLEEARAWDHREFDSMLADDPRRLVQQFGSELGEAQDRAENLQQLIEHAHSIAPGGGGEMPDALAPLLAVLTDYARDVSNNVFRVRRLSMAMLHQAGMIAPSQQPSEEVAHG